MTEKPEAAIEGTVHSVGGEGVVRMKARYKTDVDDLWKALTDPQRLVRWYGKVEGDLRLGGEFTATVFGSGWDGRGRIDVCLPPWKAEVTMWEEVGAEGVVAAELVADGDHTGLVIERRGVPLDKLFAYGAGWQAHLEDLAAHLTGQERPDWATAWSSRWDELAPSYREMKVVPLER
ncbi:MAG: SRPBCC domain-containing protein [Candidatus Dormiibacterota bacterium]